MCKYCTGLVYFMESSVTCHENSVRKGVALGGLSTFALQCTTRAVLGPFKGIRLSDPAISFVATAMQSGQ